jgi:hypothetical protein
MRRRTILILASVLVVVGLSVAGIGWVVWFVRLDSPLAAEAPEQTVTLEPGQWSKPGDPLPPPQMSATVSISPRDQMGTNPPAPSSTTPSPVSISGPFACNH